ncbi:MAG: hypothetical protein ACR2RL_02195, partial [Gammaproteobacteria bacterium]
VVRRDERCGVLLLRLAYELTRVEAAGMTSLLLIGWAFGAPFFGWLSDRLGRRKPPLYLGLAISLLALSSILLAPLLPVAFLSLLCLLAGVGRSAQIVNFALARESVGLRLLLSGHVGWLGAFGAELPHRRLGRKAGGFGRSYIGASFVPSIIRS